MRSGTPLPYWLVGGTERCEICFGRYVLELERRCVACDAGLCPECVVVLRATAEVFCVPCHDAEEVDAAPEEAA